MFVVLTSLLWSLNIVVCYIIIKFTFIFGIIKWFFFLWISDFNECNRIIASLTMSIVVSSLRFLLCWLDHTIEISPKNDRHV